MIQKYSVLNVIDNSGAKTVKCIHLYQGYRRRYAKIGDMIKVSVQSIYTDKENQKTKKGAIYKAIVLSSKIEQRTSSGYSFRIFENEVALFKDKTNKILSNKIAVPVLIALRHKKYMRILSIAPARLL